MWWTSFSFLLNYDCSLAGSFRCKTVFALFYTRKTETTRHTGVASSRRSDLRSAVTINYVPIVRFDYRINWPDLSDLNTIILCSLVGIFKCFNFQAVDARAVKWLVIIQYTLLILYTERVNVWIMNTDSDNDHKVEFIYFKLHYHSSSKDNIF